jgi:hypothetical protein
MLLINNTLLAALYSPLRYKSIVIESSLISDMIVVVSLVASQVAVVPFRMKLFL